MSGPNFAALEIAENVLKAERRAKEQANILSQIVARVQSSISKGARLNELGEVQSAGVMFDVACGRLEEAVGAFNTILNYRLEQNFDTGSCEADFICTTKLWALIDDSPRLTAIMAQRMRVDRPAQ